jgi:osmotically-inducible protein OsmY
VTLTGEVATYSEKRRAKRAVERVARVRGVANEIEVRVVGGRSDTDIAKAAGDALKWHATVPESQRHPPMARDVYWEFQRRAAERAVRDLLGVRGITTLIAVKPRVEPHELKQKIEETFKREATLTRGTIAPPIRLRIPPRRRSSNARPRDVAGRHGDDDAVDD